ncbi:hypothetical protein GCM10018962_47250 [Dactylosporangium matsuzakiense]|uniref:Uncharacterized protein n=1 Tax=Dactylosporangium matsuzakiense TaxID=53360 RepID=A0A9W6NPV9_9ACTN|nr:hypothetical protein GCM10017581_062140 [Dactylosporangium matsuzakiense]
MGIPPVPPEISGLPTVCRMSIDPLDAWAAAAALLTRVYGAADRAGLSRLTLG